tara:strand:- start:168 stop:314 length:147 start_codon:yes stop_codon:yes gene_type:complete
MNPKTLKGQRKIRMTSKKIKIRGKKVAEKRSTHLVTTQDAGVGINLIS